jgi:hypothetical protein
MNDKAREKQVEENKPDAHEEEVLLNWVTHPAKARPMVTVIVVVFLTILVAIVYNLTESVVFSAVAALILWGSLAQYFLPTKFELTETGVRVRYTFSGVQKEWRLFRSYYVDKNGVLLSPFVRPSRLENFRGLYVRFAGNKDEVVGIVSDKIDMPSDDFD